MTATENNAGPGHENIAKVQPKAHVSKSSPHTESPEEVNNTSKICVRLDLVANIFQRMKKMKTHVGE